MRCLHGGWWNHTNFVLLVDCTDRYIFCLASTPRLFFFLASTQNLLNTLRIDIYIYIYLSFRAKFVIYLPFRAVVALKFDGFTKLDTLDWDDRVSNLDGMVSLSFFLFAIVQQTVVFLAYISTNSYARIPRTQDASRLTYN